MPFALISCRLLPVLLQYNISILVKLQLKKIWLFFPWHHPHEQAKLPSLKSNSYQRESPPGTNLNTTHGRTFQSPLSQPASLPLSRPQCSRRLPQGERSSGRGPGQHTHRFDLHHTGCSLNSNTHTRTHTFFSSTALFLCCAVIFIFLITQTEQIHPLTVFHELGVLFTCHLVTIRRQCRN